MSVSVHAMWEGVLFTLSADCQGSESCRQAKNNYLNKRKSRVGITSRLERCHRCSSADFELLFTVQTRLKIANNPIFDSSSIHRSGATARMKTNLLKDNISIQFEVKLAGVLRVTFKLLLRIVPPLLRWMD